MEAYQVIQSLREARREMQWRIDHVNQMAMDAARAIADDMAEVIERLKNKHNVGGFSHTRGGAGAKLDSALERRKTLYESIAALDYLIGIAEAEDAAQ
jgi:hypothetical protein